MGRAEEPERGSEVGIREGEGMGRDTLELMEVSKSSIEKYMVR